jgi:probable rRNA maturation factor
VRVVCINAQREVRFSLAKNSVQSLLQEVFRIEKRACDELSVIFISDKKMRAYHKQLFNDPSSTDCITIPLQNDFQSHETYRFLGEILVCPKTAHEYATKMTHVSFWDELSLYVIHGVLHLLGYDDIDPADKIVMRRKEKKHLLHLRKNCLLLSGTFR